MPIVEGEVQGFEESKSGKPKIKIAGSWYYLGNTVMDVAYGDRVSAEWIGWSPDDNPKIKLRLIQGWGMAARPSQPAPPPPPEPPPVPPPPQSTPQQQRTEQLSPGPSPERHQEAASQTKPPQAKAYADLPRDALDGQPLHDADQLRLISNVMAALVGTGLIKTRGEACKWIFALSCGVRGVQFFESEIPF